MQASPLRKSGGRHKSENGFQWVLASTCCCVWAPSVTTGQSKPLLPQSLIPMTTTSLMKEAQLVMSRSSGVIQSTSTKLDDVWTVLHALYWKRMTIAPMMRYLILDALEWSVKGWKCPLCIGTLTSLHAITDGKRFLSFLSSLPLPALLNNATTTTSTNTALSCTTAFFAHFQGKMVALGFDSWATSWLLGWANSY